VEALDLRDHPGRFSADLPPEISEAEEDAEEVLEGLEPEGDVVTEALQPVLPVEGTSLNPPINEGLPVGARLAHFAPIWAQMFGQDSRASRTVSKGVGLSFKTRPLLTRHPVHFQNKSSLERIKRATSLMIEKRVIEPVRDRSSLGFYSRLFLVPKRSGEDRPIIDLSPLNRQLEVPKFRMETQVSVREAICPGEWTTSIDIKDAYLHVPMAQATQRFLRFRVGSQVYQYRALPFGLSSSPREFTKLLQPVIFLLRSHGIRVHAYLDDWLIRADSAQRAVHDAQLVANLLQHLGWIVNRDKSCFQASQNFLFLGMSFQTDLEMVQVRPSEDLRQRLVSRLKALHNNPVLTAKQWSSLFGLLQYMAPLVPQGRLRLRPIQWSFKKLWCQATGTWEDRLTLPRSLLAKLRWWISPEAFTGVLSVTPPSQLTLFTDASTTGWGATVMKHKASGIWNTQLAQLHINALEIQAVWQALKEFQQLLSEKVIRIMIDNRTAVAYIRRVGGIRSRTLNDLALKVHRLALKLKITLIPVYIQGSRNVAADALSRRGQHLDAEWVLNPSALLPVFRIWGRPWLDLFATRENKQMHQFVSPFPDEEAFQVDAMSFDWSSLNLIYAFPPRKLLAEVIRKFKTSSGTQMILIAPLRMSASWMPELMKLSRARLKLRQCHNFLTQMVESKGITLHKSPESLCLHAWLL
jgi:hypothetical protein